MADEIAQMLRSMLSGLGIASKREAGRLYSVKLSMLDPETGRWEDVTVAVSRLQMMQTVHAMLGRPDTTLQQTAELTRWRGRM